MYFFDLASNKWNTRLLIDDLSHGKQQCRQTREGLTDREICIVCAILHFADEPGRYNLTKIAEKISSAEDKPITANGIGNMLSSTIYDYFEYLINERPQDWKHFVKLLEVHKYRISNNKPEKQNPIIEEEGVAIIVSEKKITELHKTNIQEYARKVTGDKKLRILRTENRES